MKRILILAAGLAIISARAFAADVMPPRDEPPAVPDAIVKSVMLKNIKGEAVGEARLTETKGGVLMTLDLYNLPPGEHGLHFHEKGDCDPEGGFKAAGGHFNPHGHPHGFLKEGGPHDGDIPNIFIDKDGTASAHVMNTRITLDAEDKDGRAFLETGALIIHEKPDDYVSQPAGNAGERIACGIVK